MPTTQSAILAVVLARLQAIPALVPEPTDRVRLSHRTPVARSKAPAIHVVPRDSEATDNRGGECVRRRLRFQVRIFGRSDDGIAGIDTLIAATLTRLKPGADDALPYPAGVIVQEPRRMQFEEDVADEDAASADLEITADYSSAEWSI